MARKRPQHRLFGESLKFAAAKLLEQLGTADRDRLQALVEKFTTEEVRITAALALMFPDKEEAAAFKQFTNFRSRINTTAEELLDPLRLMADRLTADTRKKSPPSEPNCWFIGQDPAEARVIEYGRQVTADLEGQPEIHSRGIATTSTAMASGKRVVRFFVSYAHEDDKGRSPLAEKLLKELRNQFRASARYELDLWIDRRIRPSEEWHEQIQEAIKECDFGLFLVSPAFLGSEYIGQHEMPPFVAQKLKPVIPVGLIRVDFDRQDLKGLKPIQFYLGPKPPLDQFYSALPGTEQKRQFVHGLFLKIEELLDAHFGSAPAAGCGTGNADESADAQAESDGKLDELHRAMQQVDETANFQRTMGHPVTLMDMERIEPRKFDPAQARDALDEIEDWAANAEAPPFFALLGEYGIGKTTTLKQLTRRMLARRQADATRPLPIYIDLRDYVALSTTGKGEVPTIEELLASVIERNWKLADRSIQPADVLHWVRHEGAVIFFDGLDEKIVHMTPDRARAFIRTLWSTIPDANRPAAEGVRRGKLLISCRSHYFRDVATQNSMLVGEDREGISREAFPAFCLLPFTEEQIRNYLVSFYSSHDPDPAHARSRAEEAFGLISTIHNLRDLAERPYLLTQIIVHIDELERRSQAGETVNAAGLYELFITAWLNRDDGKHQLDPLHKRQLMEALALDMWNSGEKQWEADALEIWLDRFLLSRPEMISAYQNKDRALLKEDLRTATFVLRPETEQKSFRFAHTSLQEFFLAAALMRALEEGQVAAWQVPLPSLETLDFLGQLLQLRSQTKALSTLGEVLGQGGLGARAALGYWLRAVERDMPLPTPRYVNLEGLDLQDWTLRGREGAPLQLKGANLKGALLNRCRLEHVQLSGADLTGAQSRQGLWLHVWAANARLAGLDAAGLQWRWGSLAGASFTGEPAARLHGLQLLGLDLTAAELPEDWQEQASAALCRGLESNPLTADTRLHENTGHRRSVYCAAWSPDGTRLATASYDHSVKLWDPRAGDCLATLSGHTSTVWSCAWSPDGTRLATASGDNSVKLWDPVSGQCLQTCINLPEGETYALNAAGQLQAYSPAAWRYLGWVPTDPSQRQRLYPLELGPLPEGKGI